MVAGNFLKSAVGLVMSEFSDYSTKKVRRAKQRICLSASDAVKILKTQGQEFGQGKQNPVVAGGNYQKVRRDSIKFCLDTRDVCINGDCLIVKQGFCLSRLATYAVLPHLKSPPATGLTVFLYITASTELIQARDTFITMYGPVAEPVIK